jgi:hypothetical protein
VTFNDPVFEAFNDFDIDDMPAQADISRRMLRRLEDIDNASTAGPAAPAARAALATSVVAHAVVELETQLIELKRQLEQGFSTQSSPTSRLRSPYECTRSTSLRTDTTTKQRTTARLYSQSPQEVPAHTNVSSAFPRSVKLTGLRQLVQVV